MVFRAVAGFKHSEGLQSLRDLGLLQSAGVFGFTGVEFTGVGFRV